MRCYDSAMSSLLKFAAFALLATIVFLTLGPVGIRSSSPFPAQIDRMGAFFVLGLMFSIAYPRHIWLVALGLIVAAVGLEYGQLLRPGRHAQESDVIVKSIGAVLGVSLGWAYKLSRRWVSVDR